MIRKRPIISKYFKEQWIIDVKNPNKKFKIYIYSARIRGKVFMLKKEEAISLFKQACHYCGVPPEIGKLNGIDRYYPAYA